MGSAASRWTSGLSATAWLLPAIDGAANPQRLNLHLDAASAWAAIILTHVAMRQLIDVLPARVFRPVHHPAQHLRPAPHILGIDQQQRDPRIALEVLEPTASGAAVDPEGAILEFEPDRHLLDAAVLSGRPDDRGKDLLHELLHLGTQL